MAQPTVVINSSTGSDTAASGAGPATAVTGTSNGTSNGATPSVITLGGAPDLSGVATDGSAVLWLNTAAGRKFSKITAADNTAKTVTIEDTITGGNATNVSWAIGGKRAGADAGLHTLFADFKAGWTVDFQPGTYTVTTTLAFGASGSASVGPITLTSTTGGATITTATNSVSAISLNGKNMLAIDNLAITCTAGTPGDGGIQALTGNSFNVSLTRCTISGFASGVACSNIGNDFEANCFLIQDCEIKSNTVRGIGIVNLGNIVDSCYIHGNTGDGILVGPNSNASSGSATIRRNLITGNTANGVKVQNTVNLAHVGLDGNVIAGNTSAGFAPQGANTQTNCYSLTNNRFESNGTYGVNFTNATPQILLNRNNGYWNNTTAARNNLPAGTGDVVPTGDPSVNAAGANYALNTTSGAGLALRGAGFPGTFRGSSTTGSPAIGAVMPPDGLDPWAISLGSYSGSQAGNILNTLFGRIPGTVQPQTGDAYARLGATPPTAAQVATAILTDTTSGDLAGAGSLGHLVTTAPGWYTPPPSDYQQRGVAVTLPANPPAGFLVTASYNTAPGWYAAPDNADVVASLADVVAVQASVGSGLGAAVVAIKAKTDLLPSSFTAPDNASIVAIKAVTDLLGAEQLTGVVLDAAPSAASFRAAAGLAAVDGFYVGSVLAFTSGTLKGLARKVTGYAGVTRALSFTTLWPALPASGDTFVILGRIED
jgi:hypothetical protein